MQDNGSRYEHETGALREDVSTKGMRPELIPPEALMRVATWYGDGAKKYSDRNWEKGLPFTNCIGSMFRHLIKYMNGHEDEDHLAAIVWNANALMHYEKHKPDMDDRPAWSKAKTCSDSTPISYEEYMERQEETVHSVKNECTTKCCCDAGKDAKTKAELEKLQKVAALFACIEEML